MPNDEQIKTDDSPKPLRKKGIGNKFLLFILALVTLVNIALYWPKALTPPIAAAKKMINHLPCPDSFKKFCADNLKAKPQSAGCGGATDASDTAPTFLCGMGGPFT